MRELYFFANSPQSGHFLYLGNIYVPSNFRIDQFNIFLVIVGQSKWTHTDVQDGTISGLFPFRKRGLLKTANKRASSCLSFLFCFTLENKLVKMKAPISVTSPDNSQPLLHLSNCGGCTYGNYTWDNL